MSILDRLKSDMVTAAKARDAGRLGVIRFVRAQTKNREIELKRELDDEDVIGVLVRLAKQHREAIEQFTEGGRDELVEKERRQLAVIEEYLPEPLDEDELEALLVEVLEETGASGPGDMGDVMKAIMPKVKGRADGKAVKALVLSRLTGGAKDEDGQ
jgi:uncharacterized protein YqeY